CARIPYYSVDFW
nr:immunoglobulin heavy chain junction region [Macaca mulatta]